MARQAGLYTPFGLVYVTETRNAPAGLDGVYLDQTSGGGTISAYGTANGQASVSGGVANIQVYGTANGRASVSGGVATSGTLSAAGTAQGQASAASLPAWTIAVAGTAQGHASASSGGVLNAVTLTDGVIAGQALPWYVTLGKIITQNMTVHPAYAPTFLWVRTLAQHLSVHLTDAEKMTYTVTDVQVIHLAQAIYRTYPVVMSQAITVHQAQAIAVAITVLQKLNLVPHHIPTATFHMTLAQAIVMNAALARFFGVTLTQAMHVHPTQALQYVASSVMSQNLTVHAALHNTLVLSFTETIEITPTRLLTAIFQGEALIDGINLTGLYVDNAGMVTTWAVNTRTNAVTTYDNYNFTGFAALGNRYIGTNKNGVYELDGETDDGAYILANIRSGFMQLNATKMSGLKGVYLAIRGRGEFFFKLITGDGREYVYKALTQPGLMNTKINVGKGMRTRYIAWELVSTGSDFDMDSLEFVPMLSDRRV